MGKCSALGNENEIVLRTAEFYGKKGILLMPQKQRLWKSQKMMNVYADFAENFMAIPVIKGIKQKPNALLGLKKRIVSKL
jgi:prolyl-tRNA synthetase